MTKRNLIVPTILVAAAIALLIKLGVWQLDRARQNEALLATYRSATHLPPITFPTAPTRTGQLPVYRYAAGNCLRAVHFRTAAGENRFEEPGYLIIADCATGAEGPGMSVEV